jgi:hypothetical protein
MGDTNWEERHETTSDCTGARRNIGDRHHRNPDTGTGQVGLGLGHGGFALGAFIGAALARPAYGYGYYPAYSYGYYGYGYPAYSYGYGYYPAYSYGYGYYPAYRYGYYGGYRPFYRPAFYGGYRVAPRAGIYRARWR